MKNKPLLSFSVLLILFIISCKKIEDKIMIDKIALVQKHIWILDSTNTITPYYDVTQVDTPLSSYTFLTDTLLLNYRGTAILKYGLVYEAPDKVYYWLPSETKNLGEYIIIELIDESRLKLKETDISSQTTRIRFCHAQ